MEQRQGKKINKGHMMPTRPAACYLGNIFQEPLVPSGLYPTLFYYHSLADGSPERYGTTSDSQKPASILYGSSPRP